MSASFYWTPTKTGKSLPVSGPSKFIETMNKVFGPYPWILKEENVSTLRAMSAASDWDNKTYELLADLIQDNGEMELRVEY